MSFQQQYEYGKAAESCIARWLMRRGFSVLPVYEKIITEGKGPQLFSTDGDFIAPDMLVIKSSREVLFVEAKHKNAFSWHRKTQRFVTGIDWHHYQDYQKVAKKTGIPLWILFLQEGGIAKDAPLTHSNSPRGLFGNEIEILIKKQNHCHGNWGRFGMVYWAIESDGGVLRQIASYEDVVKTTAG